MNVAPFEPFQLRAAQSGKRADCDIRKQLRGSGLEEASGLLDRENAGCDPTTPPAVRVNEIDRKCNSLGCDTCVSAGPCNFKGFPPCRELTSTRTSMVSPS